MTDEPVNQIVKWILEGNSEQAIREGIRDTWPTASEQPLIAAAIESIIRAGEATRSTIDAWAIEAVKFLYAKQVEIGEYAGAMRAVKMLVDLAATKPEPERSPTPITAEIITYENFEDQRRRLLSHVEGCADAGGVATDPGTDRETVNVKAVKARKKGVKGA